MKSRELVRETIRRYDMLPDGGSVVVGFSGGSDSVCLVSILYELGYNVTAAHMNHNMRDTADRDMEFCRSFCNERSIPFFCKTAEQGMLKSEADAREARYAFFAEVLAETGIDLLATAHNKNDSAETVLLHMLRGASTDGLRGILPKDKGIIRPLIAVKKSEVLDYCEQNNLEYMTDETNLTDMYLRNRLRNRVFPELEKEFNPRLIDSIADNALLTAQDADYITECAKAEYERLLSDGGVEIDRMLELHPALLSRIVQLLWRENNGQNLPHGYVSAVLDLAKKGKTGSGVDLPHGYRAEIQYGKLKIIRKTVSAEFCYDVKPEEWCDIPEAEMRILISQNSRGMPISLDGNESLCVRSKINGDRFRPDGLNGSKKLSDLFTDLKIPKNERDKVPVLCANGAIAAVVGIRTDEAFAKNKRKNNFYIEISYYKANSRK